MKHLLLAFLLATVPVAASDLVQAAKAAKEKKKKSTTRVLTNADAKKARGNVVETSNVAEDIEPLAEQTATERHAAEKLARAASEAKRAAAEALVADLEKQLAAVEQQYYDENDLRRRDTEIVKRFADVKEKLEAARKELE